MIWKCHNNATYKIPLLGELSGDWNPEKYKRAEFFEVTMGVILSLWYHFREMGNVRRRAEEGRSHATTKWWSISDIHSSSKQDNATQL